MTHSEPYSHKFIAFDGAIALFGGFGCLTVVALLTNIQIALTFALPTGFVLFGLMSSVRRRYLPLRYTFAAVDPSQRVRFGLTLAAIFGAVCIWHVVSQRWYALSCATTMGGLLLLFMAHDFRNLDLRHRGASST
jgi:hypothetical protein